MLKKLIGLIWRKTPSSWRLRSIRATQTKFTASVAAVIVNEAGEVLLLDHLLPRPFSSWGIPGGFARGGEQPEIAVRRELREETGLELARVELVGVRTIGYHLEILFRAEAAGTPTVKSREIVGVGWFAPERLPAGFSPVQTALIEKVLRGQI